eukprot:10411578-Alexandrium_andersonii.AAC.1
MGERRRWVSDDSGCGGGEGRWASAVFCAAEGASTCKARLRLMDVDSMYTMGRLLFGRQLGGAGT